MPPEAAHHGNKTSSMVEVAAFMMLPARCQNTMAASFFHTLALVRTRWVALSHSFNRPQKCVPLRIEQFHAAALKRASEKQCSLQPQTYQLLDRETICTNPASLDVDITVLVLREGPLSISLADPMHKAWAFIHGGRDSVRQSHIVNLACIHRRDWWNLCTCRRNGYVVGYCAEVTWLLHAFALTDLFHKPWTTTKACQKQLGTTPPTALLFDPIRTRVRDLQNKGELKQLVQPRLVNAHRGGRPEAHRTGRLGEERGR
jgi:hypothetical protein